MFQESEVKNKSPPLGSGKKVSIESSFGNSDQSAASLQTGQNNIKLKEFTKILEQNRNLKELVSAPKESAQLTPDNKPDQNNSPIVFVVEDDDLIPPTPSPGGLQSFINCIGHKSSLSTNISQTLGSNLKDVLLAERSEHGFLEPVLSEETCSLSTLTTSRKKYKLSRKPSRPKFLSSPLKKHDIFGSKPLLRNKPQLKQYTEQLDQRESSCVDSSSKFCVLTSRMKRSPAKGSSPVKKRLQIGVSSSMKVLQLPTLSFNALLRPVKEFCLLT